MKIKAAIFDMDGTLINSLIMWDVMWSRFGEKYLGDGGFRPSAEDEKRVRTLTLRDAMHLIHKNIVSPRAVTRCTPRRSIFWRSFIRTRCR